MPSRRACSSLPLSGQTLKTFEFEVTDHLTPCQADGPNLTAIPEEMRTGPSPRAMPSLPPPAAEAGRAMSLPVMTTVLWKLQTWSRGLCLDLLCSRISLPSSPSFPCRLPSPHPLPVPLLPSPGRIRADTTADPALPSYQMRPKLGSDRISLRASSPWWPRTTGRGPATYGLSRTSGSLGLFKPPFLRLVFLLPLRRKQRFLLVGPRVLPFPPNACISPKATEASFQVTPKTVPLLKTTHLTPPVATVESRFTAARALTARSLRSVGLQPEQASETPARLVETPAPGLHLPEVWMGPENPRL